MYIGDCYRDFPLLPAYCRYPLFSRSRHSSPGVLFAAIWLVLPTLETSAHPSDWSSLPMIDLMIRPRMGGLWSLQGIAAHMPSLIQSSQWFNGGEPLYFKTQCAQGTLCHSRSGYATLESVWVTPTYRHHNELNTCTQPSVHLSEESHIRCRYCH